MHTRSNMPEACAHMSTNQTIHLPPPPSGCSEVTSLEPLSSCPGLTQLHLGGCRGLVSLQPLSACSRLQNVQLSHCRHVSSLTPLLDCINMQQVCVWGGGGTGRGRMCSRCRWGGCGGGGVAGRATGDSATPSPTKPIPDVADPRP